MRQLNYGLMRLCRRNRDGSYATQAARNRILSQAASDLHRLGYRGLKVTGLRSKHVAALVADWQSRSLSSGTMKNRLSHLRWWAEKIDRPGVVSANNETYAIPRRNFVAQSNKAFDLDDRLARIRDPYVAMSLRLQSAFGLRREEAIKIRPSQANQGELLILQASWTKGGRAREIPIRINEQRLALATATRLAGTGSLIPLNRRYIDQLRIYERQTQAAGFSKLHGLRHRYAQVRYAELTGWKSPIAGGPKQRDVPASLSARDIAARQIVSRELGHERLDIVSVYLGT